ncbi:hypothetical protein [Haloparvum sedimenti]|uniref:hypothetical protein n=1 Tax=Haloparvum sedimenti TaxID=1678448 RepID=UPI000F781E5D|nr:hypothetical protein [Haloparvum sedimenti]
MSDASTAEDAALVTDDADLLGFLDNEEWQSGKRVYSDDAAAVLLDGERLAELLEMANELEDSHQMNVIVEDEKPLSLVPHENPQEVAYALAPKIRNDTGHPLEREGEAGE